MRRPFIAFDGFRYSDAMPFEEGVTRRDPSPVVRVDDLYHVWYSKNVEGNPRPNHGFSATIWHATSPDGVHWQEDAEAFGRGGPGAFDECGVYTPTILVVEDRYYLYYTAMPREWPEAQETTCGAIGVAVSDSPFGPWTRAKSNPVLRCSPDKEEFDCLRVDDACIIVREGEYWMYYKGRPWGESTAGQTKMGLARAQNPLGPWRKYEKNPVLDSGHEVCVWPHGHSVGCLVSNAGPQGDTLQYSDDGIHFRKIAHTVPPIAPGPYREEHFTDGVGPGITWGLAIGHDPSWPYLVRFDCNLRATDDAE